MDANAPARVANEQLARGTGRVRAAGLDVIRGCAALGVMLYHAAGFFFRSPSPHRSLWSDPVGVFRDESPAYALSQITFGLGHLGVPVFFFVSGFCIYLGHEPGRHAFASTEFWRSRMLRIYPLYLATIALGFAHNYLLAGWGSRVVNGGNILGHLAFWHYGLPPLAHGSVEANIVIWSLAIEVEFYLLFALTSQGLLARRLGHLTASLCALGVAYRIAFDVLGPYDLPYYLWPRRFTPGRYWEWLLGAWCAQQWLAGGFANDRSSARWYSYGVGIFVIGVGSVVVLTLGREWADVVAVVSTYFLVRAALVHGLQERARRAFSSAVSRMADWASLRSYSLYMTHFIVLAAVGDVAARVLGIRNKDAAGGTLQWLGVTSVAVAACLLVAEVAYRVIERPSHEFARQARATARTLRAREKTGVYIHE